MTWRAGPVGLMIVAVLAASLVIARHFWPDEPAKPSSNILAGEATVVQPEINVITFKPTVKKKQKLPKAVQANERQQVTAATRVEQSERQTEVTAVLDMDTGRTELFTREIERPWMEWQNRNRFGVYLGINHHGQVTVRAVARHEFARTGPVTWAAVGMADMTRGGVGGFVGIGAEF